ncbi:hypothetical protein O6H91_04G106000 [Diphasiastrum complanatum]|uniref:Uncharacterized protein n=1 Tax=Diphasiastrum complanatum TaxID=34168 RepID=A0ACC2DZX1_DIPCM|nr:hypothetical protein O6H91_04G106000 [Diphasiastrum complanatum]
MRTSSNLLPGLGHAVNYGYGYVDVLALHFCGTDAPHVIVHMLTPHYLYGLSRVWKKAPKPLREFPWRRAIERLVERLSDVAWSAAKWLLVPVILLSSLSEISYSLVQNKEFLIPIGMLAGSFLAGVLKDAAVELSEDLQKGEVPWHLIAIGFLFSLVKFPGPSYPYWGRVLLPHFATGGLLRTFFFAWSWQNSTISEP